METWLDHQPGKQLVIVRYWGNHDPFDEWVYNAADIDGSQVIWARDGDPAGNPELIRYYKDRTVWLVEPDATPARIQPYPMTGGQRRHRWEVKNAEAWLFCANEATMTFVGIEFGLMVIAMAFAFAWPGLGAGGFARVERIFRAVGAPQGIGRNGGWGERDRAAAGIAAAVPDPAAVCARRFQFPARLRHLRSWTAQQSYAGHVDAL